MSEDKKYYGRVVCTIDKTNRMRLPMCFLNVFQKLSNVPEVYSIASYRNDLAYLNILDSAMFQNQINEFNLNSVERIEILPKGRILIPDWQVKHASLENKILVAASPKGDCFELWNIDAFNNLDKSLKSYIYKE